MSIELTPLGKTCNIRCTYCYQQDERSATDNRAAPYDLDAIKRALITEGVKKGVGWTLFGGESLLFPIDDLEHLLEWSTGTGATMGCQTNGSILTDRHVELFKRHHVGVGVSLDGPDDLNDARQAVSAEATRTTTALSMRNLTRLLAEGISTSLIVTLSRINVGDDEKLDRLIAWLLDLRDKGLRWINLHTMEPHGQDLSLTQERQIAVMSRLRRELVGFSGVHPFHDMRKSLLQESGANCVWNFCDPYTTPAVQGVDGQGNRSNCGRTNHGGVAYEKGATAGHERQFALYLTPQSAGGCAECRFFVPCGGGNCPGEGVSGDWRNRTVHCQTIKALMGEIEADLFSEGKEPISMSLRRPLMEYQMLSRWAGLPDAGNLSDSGNREHGDVDHGDHDDTERPIIIDSEGKRIQ